MNVGIQKHPTPYFATTCRKAKPILLDCDGVLLDWESGFGVWLDWRHNIKVDPAGPLNWNLSEWLGEHGHRTNELLNEFNHSTHFGHLQPVTGAVETVREIHDAGHTITVLTSCSAAGDVVRRRKANLVRHFGHIFTNLVCLDLGVCKRQFLGAFEPGIWVEDNYKGAFHGRMHGHATFMLEQQHNRSDKARTVPGIKWAADWNELRPLIRNALLV